MSSNHPLNLVANVDLGLPPPQQFNNDMRSLALPQILAFASACLIIVVSVLFVRSFNK